MAATQAEICRRGVLRPFHGWPLSARHDNPALAARQEARAMHHGATPAEIGSAGNVAPQAKVGERSDGGFCGRIVARQRYGIAADALADIGMPQKESPCAPLGRSFSRRVRNRFSTNGLR